VETIPPRTRQRPGEAIKAHTEAAERRIADCDKRLAKYRQLLDRDEADVALVSVWSRRSKENAFGPSRSWARWCQASN
jgi:hypothetical protein